MKGHPEVSNDTKYTIKGQPLTVVMLLKHKKVQGVVNQRGMPRGPKVPPAFLPRGAKAGPCRQVWFGEGGVHPCCLLQHSPLGEVGACIGDDQL